MRTAIRRIIGGLVVVGGAVVLRPGTPANRAAREAARTAGRRLRDLAGRLEGLDYRLRHGQPDPDVDDRTLTDRIRSGLGPLERRLDVPRVHVMVEDHVVTLHGEVGTSADAREIEGVVGAMSGVRGVESYLHVGLGRGSSRPSAGRAVHPPSPALQRLLAAATSRGIDDEVAPSVVRAVLATFADRLPDGERDHVAGHLPADARALFTPPRRLRHESPARMSNQLVEQIVASTDAVPRERADELTAAILHELRELVPEEAADVLAVLPEGMRELWVGQ
jgi:uncharacterized protein (DUF2267 family)